MTGSESFSALPPVRPERVIADLRELASITGGADGAHRVAWTPGWHKAREWLQDKLAALPCEVEVDGAGNLWATTGPVGPYVAVGSHLDSVPGGGWLDGAYGVVTGLELLRRHSVSPGPVALRLVDWADEEGVRFGRSLFGSSAAAGALDLDAMLALSDGEMTLRDAMIASGVAVDRIGDVSNRLADAAAFLELHIEQGPVLEESGSSLAVVSGTVGVERHVVSVTGVAMHAGAAPMRMRHDPLLAVARLLAELNEFVVADDARLTVGQITVTPHVITIVPESCTFSIDLRHPDSAILAGLVDRARRTGDLLRDEVGVTFEWESQWRIAPVPFHRDLVELARQSCVQFDRSTLTMPSGALHDAAAVGAVIPAAMILVPSRKGISHSAAEDTDEAHLVTGVLAFDRLVESTLGWARTVRHSG